MENTSNDENRIINVEVEIFLEFLYKAFRKFADAEKEKEIQLWRSDFDAKFSRKQLQKIIDTDIFSKSTSVDRILKYL